MRRAPIAWGVSLLVAGGAVGAGVAWKLRGRAESKPSIPLMTCRPSASERAAARAGGPVVLMYGHSQLFDGDWELPGALVVNCAQQGMLAFSGLARVVRLPDVDPDVIFLAFGANEALHAAGDRHAFDGAAFEARMLELIAIVRERWPEAEVIVSGVVPMRPQLMAPAWRSADLGPIRDRLESVVSKAGVRLLDPSEALEVDEGGLLESLTHDGLHLNAEGYRRWAALLRERSEVLSQL